MEAQSTLIRPQRAVELHAVACIDLDFALVIFPRDAELDDTLGDGGDFEGIEVFGVFLEEGGVVEGGLELC